MLLFNLRLRHTFIAVFFILFCYFVLADISNPYKILGVHEKATLQDIRRAYKKLAKEW